MSTETKMSVADLVRWWEKRRWIYNILVGAAGIVVLLFLQIHFSVHVLLGIAYYGFMANVFYTFGWVSEVLLLVYFNRIEPFGKYRVLLFLLGTLFSILLTMLCAVFCSMGMGLTI